MPFASETELAVVRGATTVPVLRTVAGKPVEAGRPVTADDRLAAVWAHGKDLVAAARGEDMAMNPFIGDEGRKLMAKLEAAGDSAAVADLLKIVRTECELPEPTADDAPAEAGPAPEA